MQSVRYTNLTGNLDPGIFAYALDSGLALLTHNGKDFAALRESDKSGAVKLFQYQGSDPARNMTNAQLVAAIGKIEDSGWSLAGEFVNANAWHYTRCQNARAAALRSYSDAPACG